MGLIFGHVLTCTVLLTAIIAASPSTAGATMPDMNGNACSAVFAKSSTRGMKWKAVETPVVPREQMDNLNHIVSQYRGVYGARTLNGVPTIFVNSMARAKALLDLPFEFPVDSGLVDMNVFIRGIRSKNFPGKLISTHEEAKQIAKEFRAELAGMPEFEFWYRGLFPQASTDGKFAVKLEVADPHIAKQLQGRTALGRRLIIEVVENIAPGPQIEIDYAEAAMTAARARVYYGDLDGFIDARTMFVPPEGLGEEKHFAAFPGYYLELLFKHPPEDFEAPTLSKDAKILVEHPFRHPPHKAIPDRFENLFTMVHYEHKTPVQH